MVSKREILPEGDGPFTELALSSDFSPTSSVNALPTLIQNATILQCVLSNLALERDDPLINLGGDCGSELVPIAWLNERLNGQLQVVWFDAHADLNLPRTSPGGGFHGMVLRTLCGEGPVDLEPFVPRPLHPSQITLAGVRDLDNEEVRYIACRALRQLPVQAINESPDAVANVLDPDIPVYLHVDYDVLDGDSYPQSTYPSPHGLSVHSLSRALACVRNTRRVAGMSLTEYAPQPAQRDTPILRQLLTEGFGIPMKF